MQQSVAMETAAMGGRTGTHDTPLDLAADEDSSSSVRRPESGTWQSVAMETAAMGGRTGDP
ncbi:unnamed protein product [Staurois parvus]|uniref:Uncharacterized protein n=1 Tax=Staurois parvus TaxID=386267 RepID=A0ABN9EV63_9NEOB|nr:unnamed protein product [Staurois parvus]